VQAGADDVRRDHQPRPRQAVGPDPADQEERHQRDQLRPEHDADVGGVAGQVRDEQRQRDDHDAVAHHARPLREPEVPEGGVPQDS
jgi:hypothetical protein